MTNKLKLKSIATLGIAALSVLALTSCKHTSYKSISYDEVYATSGNYSITNGELWNELKWSSYDILGDKLERAVLADYIAEANEAIKAINGEATDLSVQKQKRYLDYFELLAFTELYSVSEFDSIKDLTKKEIDTKIQTFSDTVYLEDQKTVDLDSLTYSGLEATKKTLFENTKYETTYYMYNYYYRYELNVAEKIYAYYEQVDYIEDYNEDQDSEEDYYYSDEDVIQYQKENYEYREDRTAIYIRFTDEDEVNQALRSFGVKEYNNQLYFIPQNSKTNVEYSTYYDDFDVTDAANQDACYNLTQIVGDGGIFELYCQLYNYMYSYRDALPTIVDGATNKTLNRRDVTEKILIEFANTPKTVEDITATWDKEKLEQITYTQDELDDIDADFKIYVSGTLKTNPDLSDDERRYDVTGKSVASYYWLVFKISENPLEEEYKLVDDVNVDTVIPDDKKELKEELIEELIWSELTDSKIQSDVSDVLGDAKVYIYDEDVEIVYSYNVSSYSKTHKNAPTKDTLMTVVYNKKKTNITISDVYSELEKDNGVTTAIDLLSKKAIKDTEAFADTKEDIKDYKTTLDLLLAYYAQGQISDYDASLGKYNFLKLYFHETDVDTIIDDYYRVQAATAKILTDYANNTAFYKMVQKYAADAYKDSFTTTATNTLIYVDMDEDGVADTNFDWTTAVPTDTSKTYADYAKELMNLFIIRMENKDSDYASTLSSLVEEYSSSGKFTNGIDEYTGQTDEYDPTEPETRWAKYKRAGLYVSTTDYSDVSISTTESSTDDSTPTNDIKSRLHTLYNEIAKYDTYPGEYLDSESYTTGDGWLMVNSKGESVGYSMLLVTSSTVRSSAEFKAVDDVNGRFKDIKIEYDDVKQTIDNIYNDSESEASINQIMLFIYEYLNYETSTFFPSSIQTYITDFIMPVYEKYTGTATQRELLFAKTLNSSIAFANTDNNEKLTNVMNINRRQDDEYLTDEDEAYLFDDWWNTVLTLGEGD